jgi:hypothetical protein
MPSPRAGRYRFLLADVRRARDVADHRAGLARADVQDALTERGGRGDHQVAVGGEITRSQGDGHLGPGRLFLDCALEIDELFRLDRHQHDVMDGQGEKARAHRADRSRRPNDHRPALLEAGGTHVDDGLLGGL